MTPTPNRTKENCNTNGGLKINKDSNAIKKLSSSSSSSSSLSSSSSCPPSTKPPLQHKNPVIIYTHPPRVIKTHPRDFMALVQKLTGMSPLPLPTSGKTKVQDCCSDVCVQCNNGKDDSRNIINNYMLNDHDLLFYTDENGFGNHSAGYSDVNCSCFIDDSYGII